MAQHLPKSLNLHHLDRAQVMAATADVDAFTIVRGATDAGQFWPHEGVVLWGRRIVGWVTATHYEDQHGHALLPDGVVSYTHEEIVPAPGGALYEAAEPEFRSAAAAWPLRSGVFYRSVTTEAADHSTRRRDYIDHWVVASMERHAGRPVCLVEADRAGGTSLSILRAHPADRFAMARGV